MKRRRRPGQRDIARAAGVSQSVVSHVLNNSAAVSISDETRARVLAVIDELGYVPNRSAQALRLQRTSTVAALIPDITNPYYPTFIRGIQDLLHQHDLDLVTYNTDGRAELERQGIDAARRGRYDALIAVTFHLDLDSLRPLLLDGVPITVLGAQFPSSGTLPIDTASIDGVAAGKAATDYLFERGHTRIAMIAGLEATPPRESRLQGYRAALTERGIQPNELLIRGGDFTEEGGHEAMIELLKLDNVPSAVFAANDLMALGALLACREHDIRVPEDIAIVGFDDIPAARLTSPRLTTIDQNAARSGRCCAQLILDRLTGVYQGQSRHTEIPFSLVVRDSA